MINKKKIILHHRALEFTYQDACSWMFAAYMASGFLRTILSAFLSKIRLGSLYIWATNAVIFVPFLMCLIYAVLRKVNLFGIKQYLIVCAMVVLLFVTTWILHPAYEEYLIRPIFGATDAVFRPDFGALAAFLLVVVSEDSKRLYHNLYLGAVALLIYCVYQYSGFLRTGYWNVYNYLGEMDKQIYSLDFSYSCCLCASVFWVMYSMKRRLKDFAMCLTAIVLMVMGGARGAIACFAVFIVLYYARTFLLLSYRKKIFVVVAALIAVGAFYFLMPTIINRLSRVNSRSIQAILTGTFAEDNGRAHIYSIVKDALKKMSFWGYGPFGDRPFIAPVYYWGYAHNIVYEILIDFGWGLGIAILAILAIRCIQVYRKAEGYDLAILSILLGANAKLFLSASFWAYAQFWMLLAYLFVIVPVENKKSEKKKQRRRVRVVGGLL